MISRRRLTSGGAGVVAALALAMLLPQACVHSSCGLADAGTVRLQQHDTGGDGPILQRLTFYEDGRIEFAEGGHGPLCRRLPAGDPEADRLLVMVRSPEMQSALKSMADKNRLQRGSGEFLRITSGDIFVITRPTSLDPPADELVRLIDTIAARLSADAGCRSHTWSANKHALP